MSKSAIGQVRRARFAKLIRDIPLAALVSHGNLYRRCTANVRGEIRVTDLKGLASPTGF